MKFRFTAIFILSLNLIWLITACSSKGTLSFQNISDFYKPEQQIKGLDYALFNINDSLSRLYFRFPFSQLKYSQKQDGRPVAEYHLKYQVFDGYEKGVLVDSGSYHETDSLFSAGIRLDSIDIRALLGKNYILQVLFSDINARKTCGRYLSLPKSSNNQAVDFLLTDTTNKPLVRNYIFRNEKVRIRSRFSHATPLVLKHTPDRKDINPLPPYATEAEINLTNPAIDTFQDSEINFSDKISEPFSLQDEGIYTINQGEGQSFAFFRFYDGFPEIGSIEKMFESLSYILTAYEAKELENLPPRIAVDRFWIGVTGNSERALSQIKRYYHHLEEANYYFSINCEGWKSDRGMIYMIFGSPEIVYHNSLVEEWSYNAEGGQRKIIFVFARSESQSGTEDYYLRRAEEYRIPWYIAVSKWRR